MNKDYTGEDDEKGSLQSSGRKSLREIEVHVDGPYGVAFDYSGYNCIVLVAGGIGCTPCHSILSGMVSLARDLYEREKNVEGFPFVHLIWMARNAEMFDLFSETIEAAKALNDECGVDLFAFKFYHTSASDESGIGESIRQGTNIRYNIGKVTTDSALRFLEEKENEDLNKLVFCCGPKRLARDCEISASKMGAHFYAESFVFNKGNDIVIGTTTFVALVAFMAIMGAICDVY